MPLAHLVVLCGIGSVQQQLDPQNVVLLLLFILQMQRVTFHLRFKLHLASLGPVVHLKLQQHLFVTHVDPVNIKLYVLEVNPICRIPLIELLLFLVLSKPHHGLRVAWVSPHRLRV